MPHRRRAATASADNGKMTGEGKSAKKQNVNGPEMGNAGDKEVSLPIVILQMLRLTQFWLKIFYFLPVYTQDMYL